MSTRKHLIRLGWVFAVLVPTVAVVLWCLLGYFMPRVQFEDLLQGNTAEEIESVTIFDHAQRITISDPESMRYLTAAFRNSTYEGYVPKHDGRRRGWNIGVKLRGYLGTAYTSIDVYEDMTGIAVMRDFDIGRDPRFHWVAFSEPMPETLSVTLRQLRQR